MMKEKPTYDFPETFRKHYRIPEKYFEDLETRMTARIRHENPRVKRRPYAWVSLAAATVLLLIGWGFYRQMLSAGDMPPETDSLQVSGPALITRPDNGDNDFSDIPDEVIDEYLLAADDLEYDI
ncbi:MAG: hypothetical protein GXO24_02890 [Chlorobi bacterium]|nr:hypothetical protein [Chlorobiota bacterium]